ncbi:MAG: ABC transporter substrate-binding protein [Candidatus Aminicenantes bacterium]
MSKDVGFSIIKSIRKKRIIGLYILFFSVFLIFQSACTTGGDSATKTSREESLYDRVMRTGEIRASYADYPPYCIKDPKTRKLSGIMVEALNEAAKRLKLNVNWKEEVGWGTIFEGLKSNRYDVFGAGVWRNASRGKVSDFSRPMFYNVILLYGHPNETRFSENLEEINNPSVRISTQDGAMDDLIAKSDFPKAKRVSLPQLSQWTDVLLNITTGKADITFAEPGAVNLFLEKNPGTLKELLPDRPIRFFGTCFAFKLGEIEFKTMLDSALEEIINDGTFEKIIRKYEKHPGEVYRVAKPYQEPINK